jgi:protein-arginine kinase activator protein McsA
MRQLNALRLEQKAAVLREDFEKAAQIRDQIREMEQQKKPEVKEQEHPQTE